MEKSRLTSELFSPVHKTELYSPRDGAIGLVQSGTGRQPVGTGKPLENLVQFAAFKGYESNDHIFYFLPEVVITLYSLQSSEKQQQQICLSMVHPMPKAPTQDCACCSNAFSILLPSELPTLLRDCSGEKHKKWRQLDYIDYITLAQVL